MNLNRLAKSLFVAAGLLVLPTTPGLVHADNAAHGALQAPGAVSSRAQSATDDLGGDFAGLDLSADQKTQIANIRKDLDSRKQIVAKDEKLGPEQKDAFITGYAHQESSRIFMVLTPIQQKLVRSRIRARRAADEAAKKKQAAPPQR